MKDRSKKKRKKGKRKLWKGLLIGEGILILILAGCAGGFFYLRAAGEKNLKTQVPEASEEAAAEIEEGKEEMPSQEGLFVTYQGKKYQGILREEMD